jgi:hypothetical protein
MKKVVTRPTLSYIIEAWAVGRADERGLILVEISSMKWRAALFSTVTDCK